MRSKLSALFDGEQSADELDIVCSALGDPEVRRVWADYAVIRAALRRERQLNFDVSAKVMAVLAEEPTILAPQSMDVPRRLLATQISAARIRWLSALAAGLAGVSLVAWVTLGLTANEPALQLAATPAPIPQATQLANASDSTSPPRLQDYLVAHQAHTSGGAFAGGSRNVRAVSAPRGRP